MTIPDISNIFCIMHRSTLLLTYIYNKSKNVFSLVLRISKIYFLNFYKHVCFKCSKCLTAYLCESYITRM